MPINPPTPKPAVFPPLREHKAVAAVASCADLAAEHHNPPIGSVPRQTPDKREKSANAVLPFTDSLHRPPCRDRRLINARTALPQRCATFLNFLNFAPPAVRTSPPATPLVVILNFLNFAARSVTQRWTLLAVRSFSTARKNRRSGPSGDS